MDPPALQVQTQLATVVPAAGGVTTQLMACPDSANSSPRSRQDGGFVDHGDPIPPVPGAKLRLMCSYGGHIVPRPHDKSLCYIGGDTRMIAIDRHASLAELSQRISSTLLDGRHFTLKYQLPNEDLDSLITVSTDEDLENMIEEHDRLTASSPLKPARLRLFLFLAKPDTSISMGPLLADAKSEKWFVDALNSADLLNRGLSDSAAVDCLLELDGVNRTDSCTDLNESEQGTNKEGKVNPPDVHSISTMPDSPMVETGSSFGSSSSSPSMANLPPIRVRVEEQTVGLDEQFSRVNMNNIAPSTSVLQKQDDGSGVLLSAPLPPLPVYIGAVAVNSGEQASRIFSDDERSDQGAPSGFRKPPLPLQAGQRKVCDGYNLPSPDSKHAGGLSVQSPDSVASDNSIASANSLSKHMVYQEATQAGPLENRASSGPMDPKGNCSSDPRSQVQVHHDPAYLLPPQQIHQQQHQFVNSGMHYNYVYHHPATGQAPASSYYQMYPPPPAQQPLHHQPVDNQQYPMYVLPVAQTTQLPPANYNFTMQSTLAESTVVGSTRPLATSNPTVGASSAVYQASTVPTQPPIHLGLGVTQMHHPTQTQPQPVAAHPATHHDHHQMYYSHHPAAATPPPPQYQTMTPAATALLLSQATAAAQLPSDTTTPQSR